MLEKTIHSTIDMLKNILILIVVIIFEKFTAHHHVFTSFCCAILGIWQILSIAYFAKELIRYLMEYQYCKTEIYKLEKRLEMD